MFDVFGFKYNILQIWTCNTDGQSYALVTFGIINFVDVSGKMTFIFTRLIHVSEWLLCWIQVTIGIVSQQRNKMIKQLSVFWFMFSRWLHRRSWSNGQHSCFVLGRFRVKVSVWRQGILTEFFVCFPPIPPGECRDSTLKLGHDHFLPNPF
jgi:hypothetical protein